MVELPGGWCWRMEVDDRAFRMESTFLKCSFLQHYAAAETQAQRLSSCRVGLPKKGGGGQDNLGKALGRVELY